MVLGSLQPSLQLPYSTKHEAVAAGLTLDAAMIEIIAKILASCASRADYHSKAAGKWSLTGGLALAAQTMPIVSHHQGLSNRSAQVRL